MSAGALDVFATVGTDHHRFDRLVEWVDGWASAEWGRNVLIQHGTSQAGITARSASYLTYPDMSEALTNAPAVVCHGGPATIMEARRSGKVPIVVARRPDLGEHVDDHQVLFTARLAERGQITLVEDEDALHHHLDLARENPSAYRLAAIDADIHLAVRRFQELVDPLLARSRW